MPPFTTRTAGKPSKPMLQPSYGTYKDTSTCERAKLVLFIPDYGSILSEMPSGMGMHYVLSYGSCF